MISRKNPLLCTENASLTGQDLSLIFRSAENNSSHQLRQDLVLFHLIHLFHLKSAQDNVRKKVGHPNCLTIAKTSDWNLLQ